MSDPRPNSSPSRNRSAGSAPANQPQQLFRFGPGPTGKIEKPKNASETLVRMWEYLRRQRLQLIITTLLVLLTSALDLIGPYLMGRAIDLYINTGNLSGLARLGGVMLVTYLLSSAGTWLQIYIMAAVAQHALHDLRKDLFAKLQTLPLRFFDRRTHGELMSRLTNDVETINAILTSSITQLLSSVVSLVGVVIMMFVINIPLALVSMAIVPLSVLVTRALTRVTRKGFRQQQKELGDLNGIIEETITAERVVKAYRGEYKAIQEFSSVNRKLQKASTRARIFSGFMGPVMNMFNNLSLAVVVGAGGWLALNDLATVGTIAAFINYARRFAGPLNQIAQLFNSIQSALAGAERVFEILDETPELEDTSETHHLSNI